MFMHSTRETLPLLREKASELLNEFDAADGLASYYALYHNGDRCQLALAEGPDGSPEGFIVSCMTGIDLFRPLVTLRLRGMGGEETLLREGMTAGRPYLLVAPENLVHRLSPYLSVSQVVTYRILRLNPAHFQGEINALVLHSLDPSGNPHTEIKDENGLAASAGVNWRSPIFAEIYVNVKPGNRRHGWGRSLVNALAEDLMKLGVTPLYNVAIGDEASASLAEKVGFVDTGAREIMCEAVRSG